MKANKILIILAILVSLPLFSDAQRRMSPYQQRLRYMKFSGISGHIGYNIISNHLWNARYVEDYSLPKFNGEVMGGLMLGGTLDFHMNNNFYVRLGGDLVFTNFSVSGVEIDGQQANEDLNLFSMKASLIPYYELQVGHKLFPYFGLGLGISREQSKLTSNIRNDVLVANYPTYAVGMLGANYILTKEIDIGLEGRLYYAGRFDVSNLGTNSSTGAAILVRVMYRLDANFNRRRLGYRYGGGRPKSRGGNSNRAKGR